MNEPMDEKFLPGVRVKVRVQVGVPPRVGFRCFLGFTGVITHRTAASEMIEVDPDFRTEPFVALASELELLS